MFELPPQEPVATAASSERLAAAVPTLAALPNVVLVGYPVSGRSRRGIREDMNQHRPEVGGERHDAKTMWSYQPRTRGRNGTCALETSEVAITITVTMPDLQDPDRLNRADRAAWDRYIAALEVHEGNHVRIANLGAEQMQAAMRAAPSCESLQGIIDTAGAAISTASQEYDRRTRHGATEGAQF